ncbi:MAG: hypothetical protein FJ276_08045 [Planctomycetes bacterium]|nr:hypothetical protein [Planctomycetota bacterium]
MSTQRGLSPAVSLVLFVVLGGPAAPSEPSHVDVEWRFDGQMRGWVAGGHLADVAVRDAALHGRATDHDPILLGPVFELKATPTQSVEVKMRASETARAELFWTETLDGTYGGFSQEKYQAFSVEGGPQAQVYRVHPFWHAAGKIVRLRLDPPNKGQFAIEWIRIVDRAPAGSTSAAAWTFPVDGKGWWMLNGSEGPRAGRNQVVLRQTVPDGVLMSPRLQVVAEENPFVCIRMAVSAGKSGRILCVAEHLYGCESASFALRPDGKMHNYNVDIGALDKWRGRVILIGIQPSDAPDADVAIESIEIADDVRGPTELEVAYFGRVDGVNRADRPAGVTCQLTNSGSDAADVTATLQVPDGVEILGPATQTIDKLTFFRPKSVSWQIRSSRAGPVDVSLRVAASGCPAVTSAARMEFTPPRDIPYSLHVPEPQPVRGEFDIAAFYFPGWHDMSRWQPILDFPMRRPVLGWYDEANPQCADWQIKWAVEHGITCFLVDWYWSEGHRQLEHWLHDAYMKSKHKSHLKWAVMWANHNRPNTHSADDWKNVTKYWIDNYFTMPEYYRIDGRPAVFIWAPGNIRHDVGGSDEAARLYALSQAMAKEAGFAGIYFVAMSAHESEAECRTLRSEGYEAFTSYHGFQLAEQKAGSDRFPFDLVVDTATELWQKADQRSNGLLYMPIVDTGWASEPWHRSKARVITGRTPENFGQLCRNARDYARAQGKRIVVVGPVNEWGEGSYIEPYAEHGFADLDQLRAAFCPPGDFPPNLIPSDVGLGPYDLPQRPVKTFWEFDSAGDKGDWGTNGDLTCTVADGLLSGTTTGGDPLLQVNGLDLEACLHPRVTIRMRSSASDTAQLFWGTTLLAPSEANSVRFQIHGDGQFHDYELDLSTKRTWRGVIVSLRLDPANRPGVQFAIDHIRVTR